MWCHFLPFPAFVCFHDVVGVDGEALVRVDGNKEETGVGLENGGKKRNQHQCQNVEWWRRELCNK